MCWADLQGFLKRINAGKPDRLPPEAEWEYAARGGTQGPYCWGREIGKCKGNCAARSARASRRNRYEPAGRFDYDGFRLAQDL